MTKQVDDVTKRDLVMLLCKTVEDGKPNYFTLHRFAKSFQDILETKYGCTLGYIFTDPSIYGVWSNRFQEDIERYDAFSRVLDSKDDIISLRKPEGEFLLKIDKRNLERHFGDIKSLTKELQLSVD